MNLHLFLVVFTSALTALLLGFPMCRLSVKFHFLDIPGSAPHKSHRQPVPLCGGLVVVLSTGIAGLAFGAFSLATVRAILLSALIAFFFGLWDDVHELSSTWKLAGQFLATTCLILLGIKIQLFDQLPWLDYLLTYLWMVGITNAYNFVDSMDGLVTGLAGLAAAFFTLAASNSHQGDLLLLGTILVGVCAGIFYFTAAPAKFFWGDSGAQYMGFVLAGLAIAYSPKGLLRIQSWYVPILLMGVPIFDTVLVVLSRLRHGRSVYRAGFDHTYHRLVALGMLTNRAVLTMHFASFLLSCIAFVTLLLPPLAANAVFVAVVLGGFAGILFLDRTRT